MTQRIGSVTVVDSVNPAEWPASLRDERAVEICIDASIPHANAQALEAVALAAKLATEGQHVVLAAPGSKQAAWYLSGLDRNLAATLILRSCNASAPTTFVRDNAPLRGRSILTLRPAHQAPPLVAALRRLGANAVNTPLFEILPRPAQELDEAFGAIASARSSWIVFTSSNGVDVTMQALREAKRDHRLFAEVSFCCIGSATAERLSDHGFNADVVPSEYRGEAVVAALSQRLPASAAVFVLRAAVARDVIPNELRARGHDVRVVPVYENRPLPSSPFVGHLGTVDTVVFSAPSIVQRAVEAVGVNALAPLIRVAIGPITNAELKRHGLEAQIEAATYTSDGVVAAIVAAG